MNENCPFENVPEKKSTFELKTAEVGNFKKGAWNHLIFNDLNSCPPVGGVPIIRKRVGWSPWWWWSLKHSKDELEIGGILVGSHMLRK